MPRARPPRLVVTCEHGGNRVPARWRLVLAPARALLETHRGFDPGALELARRLARQLGAPLVAADVTRLLVDLNRHERNRGVFSSFTRALSRDEREQILARWHRPHRERARVAIAREIAKHRFVLHLAIHSFTPMLDGKQRNADLGLLYDPRRVAERAWTGALRDAFASAPAPLRVRFNYPYRGASDGLTRWLRTEFDPRSYAGIELEVNQALVGVRSWRRTQRDLVDAVAAALAPEVGRASTKHGRSR